MENTERSWRWFGVNRGFRREVYILLPSAGVAFRGEEVRRPEVRRLPGGPDTWATRNEGVRPGARFGHEDSWPPESCLVS